MTPLERSRAFRGRMGARILALRHAAGMSRARLGELAGVSGEQIRKYEKGFDRVPGESIQALAAALAVPVTAFFDDATPASIDPDRREAEKMVTTLMRLPPPLRATLSQLAAMLAVDAGKET